MATGKASTLTFRIEPALKDALRAAAEREHRSIANNDCSNHPGLLRANGCHDY